MKNKAFFILIFAFSIIFSSCSLFTDSFNKPVKGYLKEYTERACISYYKILISDVQTDSNGDLCIPSCQDAEILFYLQNPQNFTFKNGQNMGFELSSLNVEDFSAAEKDNIADLLKKITLIQDENDFAVLRLIYPAEFLVAAEYGHEISPYIQLFHPVSNSSFGIFKPLKLKCNSAPPPVYGPVIYKDVAKRTYVVCLNMPSAGMLSGTHKDIKTLSIENSISKVKTETAVQINDDGTFSLPESSFELGGPDSSLVPSGSDFYEAGQPVIFRTKDAFSDVNTEYIITLSDSGGLFSKVSTSVYTVKLKDVIITDSFQNEIQSGDKISQDEDSSYATLFFTPASTATDNVTGEIKDTSNSQIIFEIYQGENDSGKLLLSGNNSGGRIALKIPSGKIYIRVYAHKNLFADSNLSEFGIEVLKNMLFVSAGGSDSDNNGSENSPFKTISHAISEFSEKTANNRICLLDSISEENIAINESNAKVSIKGRGCEITGNISSNGILSLSDCTVNGNIENSGELTLSGKTRITGEIIFTQNNLFITYLPASDSFEKVADITFKEGTSYTKGARIIVAEPGKTLTHADLSRFSLTSDKYVLKLSDDKTAGYITMSGGEVIPEIGKNIKFSIDKTSCNFGDTVTVSANLIEDDTSVSFTDKMSNWKVKLLNHGSSTGVESSSRQIVIPASETWPADVYTVQINADYENVTYSASFDITVTR